MSLSLIAILLCVLFLIGSTYAWFTATRTTGVNLIKAAGMDVEVWYHESYISPDAAEYDPSASPDGWKPFVDGRIFDSLDFEPGSFAVRYIKLVNNSTFNVKFDLILPKMEQDNNELAADLLVFGATGVSAELGVDEMTALAATFEALDDTASGARNAALMLTAELPAGGVEIVAVGFELPQSYSDDADKQARFLLKVIATQYTYAHETVVPANSGEPASITAGGVTVVIPGDAVQANAEYELVVYDYTETNTNISFFASLTQNGSPVGSGAYDVSVDVGANRTVTGVTCSGETVDAFAYDASTGVLTFSTGSLGVVTVEFGG